MLWISELACRTEALAQTTEKLTRLATGEIRYEANYESDLDTNVDVGSCDLTYETAKYTDAAEPDCNIYVLAYSLFDSVEPIIYRSIFQNPILNIPFPQVPS